VGTCAASFTYGAAAGIDLSAGVVCLALAPRGTHRSRSWRGLGLVAVAVAGTTGLLCVVHRDGHAAPAVTADQVLVLATASALLPLIWYVADTWSHQEDDDRLPVAIFHLLVAALFALNRFDALVAGGAVGSPGGVLVQPLVLPVAVVGAGILRRRDGWPRLEGSVRGLRLVDRAARVTATADDPAPAIDAVRALVAEHEAMAAAGERDRIARELHDSVTQTLYSVAMVADGFPEVVADDPAAARQQAGQIRSMTLSALGDLRILLLEMRQSRLEPGSLGSLLHQMADEPDGLVQVEVEANAEPSPPAAVRVAAHRIAHQAVANARRHGEPTAIAVRLRQRGGALEVTVTDDGIGFDPAAVAPGRHGLAIMRERAASVDGELDVDSAPGAGTVVRFAWTATAFPPTTVVER
jgi:signal transduction histidine kinase